jgi:hypothetical protein
MSVMVGRPVEAIEALALETLVVGEHDFRKRPIAVCTGAPISKKPRLPLFIGAHDSRVQQIHARIAVCADFQRVFQVLTTQIDGVLRGTVHA